MVCDVEWITQAALGALIGELILGRRLGNRALAWGALFGILPKFDVLLYPLLDTAQKLAWHRGPSHSLLIMGLGSWGISQGLVKLWKRDKISKPLAGGFVFAVWSGHVLLDCFTVEGAALLWPFSSKRVAFNILYPVDFLITLPLVATVVWMTFLGEEKAKQSRSKKPQPLSKRRKLCYWGLGISAAYVAMAVGIKFLTSARFEADLSRRGTKYERRMESPTPFNILLWRSVVDRGSEFWVGYRSVFEYGATPVRWTVYPKKAENTAEIADMRETKTLMRHTDGWWIARPYAKGAWMGDLRIPESRTWGSKKGMVDSRLAVSWIVNPSEKGDHLRPISGVGAGSNDSIGRMCSRTFGNHEAWEANPRLAGVKGSLPEFLAVEE